MRICTFRLTVTILALGVLNCLARADAPDVLAQVPDNAVSVLVVKNVDALKNQITSYAISMYVPVPADPVAAPLQELGITGGFDAKGSLAVVQMKVPENAPASDDPQIPFIVLLPVSDAKLLLAGITAGDAADNITPVKLNETPGYAAVIGKYVAIGRNRAMLSEFLTHKGRMDKPAPELLKAIDDSDVTAWIDVPAEAKVVGPLWKPYSQMMRMMLRGANPSGGKSQEASIDILDAIGDVMASDVQNAIIAAKINDSGIALDVTGIFNPDSPMTKFAASQKTLPAVTLTGLPAGNYMMAGVFKWDPAFATGVMDKAMDFFVPLTPAFQGNPDAVAKFKELNAQLIPLEQGMRISVALPTGEKTGMSYVMIIDTKDPQKLHDLVPKSAQLMDSKTGDIHYDVQVSSDPVQIHGIAFTQVTTKVTLRDETPDNPIPDSVKLGFKSMQRMFPADGLVQYVGVVGNQVLVVVNPDQKMVDQAVADLQAGKESFATLQSAPAVKKLTLSDATAIGYMRIDRLMDFAKAAAGLPVAPPAAEDETKPTLPLIMSLKTSDQSATVRIALPKETLVKLVQNAHAGSMP